MTGEITTKVVSPSTSEGQSGRRQWINLLMASVGGPSVSDLEDPVPDLSPRDVYQFRVGREGGTGIQTSHPESGTELSF